MSGVIKINNTFRLPKINFICDVGKHLNVLYCNQTPLKVHNNIENPIYRYKKYHLNISIKYMLLIN